jgi:hypothetical protein
VTLRLALPALLLGLCSTLPADAASRQLELRLVYRVAPGCPAADVFLARLNEHVGYGGNNYLDGSVVIVPVGERRYRSFVQFNGGRLDELEGESCDALVDEAVRTAGLARTDSPVQKAEAQLQRALELGSVRDGWDAPPAPQEERAPTPPPLAMQEQPAPAAEPVTESEGFQPSVLGQVQYVSGALPEPALGAGVVLAAAYRGLQGRLELSMWPSQRWAFLTGPRQSQVELRTSSAALGLCSRLLGVELQLGQLQLDGCLRGALVRLESLASEDYGAGAALYGTLGSRLALGWLVSGLHVELMGGLDVARGEPSLAPASGGNRFVAENAQLAAALAIGWQFGGARAE